jgi:hypothetical protein
MQSGLDSYGWTLPVRSQRSTITSAPLDVMTANHAIRQTADTAGLMALVDGMSLT